MSPPIQDRQQSDGNFSSIKIIFGHAIVPPERVSGKPVRIHVAVEL